LEKSNTEKTAKVCRIKVDKIIMKGNTVKQIQIEYFFLHKEVEDGDAFPPTSDLSIYRFFWGVG
jgi:hypothetical protein